MMPKKEPAHSVCSFIAQSFDVFVVVVVDVGFVLLAYLILKYDRSCHSKHFAKCSPIRFCVQRKRSLLARRKKKKKTLNLDCTTGFQGARSVFPSITSKHMR